MDDLLSEFLTETAENIATLDVELVNLEQNPNDTGILSNIFRLVHTIKGTCGFLGLPRLESLAHAGENVLGKFRDGELEVTVNAVTVILHTIDRIKEILSYLEQNEAEPEGNDEDLKPLLNALAEGNGADEAVTVARTDPLPTDAAQPEAPPAEAPFPEASPARGPVLDVSGFPVAAELLAEVAAALARGKKAASERDIMTELAVEWATEDAIKKADETGELPHPSDAPTPHTANVPVRRPPNRLPLSATRAKRPPRSRP